MALAAPAYVLPAPTPPMSRQNGCSSSTNACWVSQRRTRWALLGAATAIDRLEDDPERATLVAGVLDRLGRLAEHAVEQDGHRLHVAGLGLGDQGRGDLLRGLGGHRALDRRRERRPLAPAAVARLPLDEGHGALLRLALNATPRTLQPERADRADDQASALSEPFDKLRVNSRVEWG